KIDNTLQNKPSQSGSEKRKKIPESIHKLLKEAFETHKKEGWVDLSQASSYIKDKKPDFSSKKYYSQFYKLIQDFPEKYKLEKSHKKYQCK
ncbi:OST-HTH/LOTUS domain-containing protein, partial [Akkermansia sp.]